MIDVDKAIAAAREHVHRSIGQRARWAIVAVRERVERERAVMDRASHWSRPSVQAWLRGPNRLFDPLFRGDQ